MKKHIIMQLIGFSTTAINFLILLLFFKRYGYSQSTDQVLIILNISNTLAGIFNSVISNGYCAYINFSNKNNEVVYFTIKRFLFYFNFSINVLVLFFWYLINDYEVGINIFYMILVSALYSSFSVSLTLINQHNFFNRYYYKGQLVGFSSSILTLVILYFLNNFAASLLISYLISFLITSLIFKINIEIKNKIFDLGVLLDYFKKYFFINIFLNIFQVMPFFDSFYTNIVAEGDYSIYQLSYKFIVACTTVFATSMIAIYTNKFIDHSNEPQKSINIFFGYIKIISLISLVISSIFSIPVLLNFEKISFFGLYFDMYFFKSLFIVSFIFAPSIIFLVYTRMCIVYGLSNYLIIPAIMWLIGYILIFSFSFYHNFDYPFQLSLVVSWLFCMLGIFLIWGRFTSSLSLK